MNMLTRARALLTEPTGYRPGDGNIVQQLERFEPPVRLFSVPETLKIELFDGKIIEVAGKPTPDIETDIANAAKENATMSLDTPANLTAQFYDNMEKTRAIGEASLKTINAEEDAEKSAFDDEMARLEKEVEERTQAHNEAVEVFNTRRADATRMLGAVAEALRKVDATGPIVPLTIANSSEDNTVRLTDDK